MGCSWRPGGQQCCTSNVFATGVLCSDSEAAPCIIDNAGSDDGDDDTAGREKVFVACYETGMDGLRQLCLVQRLIDSCVVCSCIVLSPDTVGRAGHHSLQISRHGCGAIGLNSFPLNVSLVATQGFRRIFWLFRLRSIDVRRFSVPIIHPPPVRPVINPSATHHTSVLRV